MKVELSDGAKSTLKKLDRPIAQRISKFILERLATLENPRSIGEALKGSKLGEFWKYRVGDYRVIASIEDGICRILVVKIGDRKDIYS